jgi:twitching motility protein PilJ
MDLKLSLPAAWFGKFKGGGAAALDADDFDVGPSESPVQEAAVIGPDVLPGAPAAAASALRIPLIGDRPYAEQVRILRTALIVLVASVLVIGAWLIYKLNLGANYIEASARMQTESQRIAKAAQQVLGGSPAAVQELRDSKADFERLVSAVTQGGEAGHVSVPATSGAPTIPLGMVAEIWKTASISAGAVLEHQARLAQISDSVKLINQRNPELLDVAEQVVALKLQTSPAPREISLAGQLVMLTQRIAKNANTLIASDLVDPENSFLLQRDGQTFSTVTSTLINGNEQQRIAPTRDAETLEKLRELQADYKDFLQAINTIMGNLQGLVAAKQSARSLVDDSGKLLAATANLSTAYQDQLTRTRYLFVPLIVLIAAAAVAVFLLVRLTRQEDQRRTADAEGRNRQQEEAILRLMNEIQSVAEGDLTVKATVTEDVTGAIADSVNYTVEELRGLVSRINNAAEQMASASSSANETSERLLQAAESQSQQIQQASASVLHMARAIEDVSASASQSADVARHSLMAAEQGASAVSNSIAGMNEIRGHIQETAKRIKRLGESSQQIGEIVGLISDITERTQVLALNAAIQAASAGDAGRGFTVVAEEVQRLAERSAAATRQIAAIVRTIQTDTQDAVSAMERSTQGVVEGAKLSDAAGQALGEISEVSRRLAALIEEISVTTQSQAQAAGRVATGIQDILSINKQTTDGTKRTAQSVGELADLARELKQSVSNFKIA